MSPHHSRKLKIAAAWVAIGLMGAVAGWRAYRTHSAELVERLVGDAQRSAVAFDVSELRQLAGTRGDLEAPVYTATEQRLYKLESTDPRVRMVYLLRFLPDTRQLLYLCDSVPRGTGGESLPGDEFSLLSNRPGLREIIRTGRPAIDGPWTIEAGTYATGYALIGSLASSSDDAASRDILAIDIDAAHWARDRALAGFQGALYVWMLLGLPLGAWLVMRRQVEQREVIRNLSEAMEQSHSAIMIVDLENRVEYVNRGLCQQIGYSRRELIGRKWSDFHVAQGNDDEVSDLTATVRAGRMWEGEWLNRRKDGTVYPVRGIVTPVRQRDGTLSCFVAVFDDVTETKRREAELRDARDHAQAGDRAKGQFLATMSHEVRTPLNGIVGFTSLLLETPLTAEQREYVQTIRMSTEALIQLTGDILDFARIESGKLNLDPLACDPRECVEDALDLLAAKAAEKKIELLHRAAGDVPAAVVTDGGRLRQVLVNLVGNAVKFTERGEVEIAIAITHEPAAEPMSGSPRGSPASSERCTLVFSVRDTGIGIPAEHQAKLFRPFTQVDESTTRRYGGTGLGLAICRNLVELMGGTISVTSEPGRGSTFTFTLPVTVAASAPPARDLGGLRVAAAIRSAGMRRELSDLVRSWQGEVIDADTPEQLTAVQWDLAVVEVDEAFAATLAKPGARLGLAAENAVALVSITLSNELRTALRAHFRLLVNKPVHHGALFALLSGARAAGTVARPSHPAQFGLRVLVVEDNPVNRRLVEKVLINLGCKPTLVEDGRQAIDRLAREATEFDLVLLDLHMPELDGMAALQEIRSGKAGPHAQTMWIIALTADAREQQRARGLEAGLNDYLTKPLSIAQLEGALRRFRTERLARKR